MSGVGCRVSSFGCRRTLRAAQGFFEESDIFVASFIGCFVDKAPDKARDKDPQRCSIEDSHIKRYGKEKLLDAQKVPESYQDLIVRVAGYSAYFIDLGKGVQDDIIRRTELSI